MKSAYSNRVVQLTCGLLLAVTVAPAVQAGVAKGAVEAEAVIRGSFPNQSLDERSRPIGDRELPSAEGNVADRVSDRNASSVLRCWQRGRMILDERDWRVVSGAGLNGPVMRSKDGPFDTMQMGQFGETFCFMKTRNGAK